MVQMLDFADVTVNGILCWSIKTLPFASFVNWRLYMLFKRYVEMIGLLRENRKRGWNNLPVLFRRED